MLTSCTDFNPRVSNPQPADTVYTVKAAMDIYDYNPERALLIIDSAEIVGNLTRERAMFYRAKVFTMTFGGIHLDSAQKLCMTLMNSNYIKDADNHESVLDLLVAITRRKQDFEQWLKWSTEKASFCRKYDNEVEALRTEAEIGVILEYLGRHDESLQLLDEVIEKLDGTRKFNEMDACIIAMRRKVDVLQQSEEFEDVIPIACKIIEKTDDYEQHPDEYHDGTFREPKAASVPNYCGFYRIKAYAYLARAYAETGDIANARHYLDLFEQSRYGQTFDGRMMISLTWCRLGDYDKMLAVYDEAEDYLKDDTVSETYSTILYNRAVAAKVRGQYDLAYDYLQRHTILSQTLSSELLESKANEFAAKYRAQEQDMEIKRQSTQNRMLNYVLLTMLLGMMITIFLYNHAMFQKKKLAEKNAALVKMIDEQPKQHTVKDDNRLAEACRLLREHPDMKITDVAKKVGLKPSNLQRLFHEQYGMSPTEYRASHIKLYTKKSPES